MKAGARGVMPTRTRLLQSSFFDYFYVNFPRRIVGMKPLSSTLAALALAFSVPLGQAAEAPRCRYATVGKLPLQYTGPSLQVTTEGVINGTPATMLVDTGAYDTFLTRTGTERRGMKLSNLGRVAQGVGGFSSLYQTRV